MGLEGMCPYSTLNRSMVVNLARLGLESVVRGLVKSKNNVKGTSLQLSVAKAQAANVMKH